MRSRRRNVMSDADIEKVMLELDAETEERLRRQVAKRCISAEKIAAMRWKPGVSIRERACM